MTKKYIRYSEACVRWGVGETRLRELVAAGYIIARYLSKRHVLLDVESGDRFFAALPRV
jgi:hypothetical protein